MEDPFLAPHKRMFSTQDMHRAHLIFKGVKCGGKISRGYLQKSKVSLLQMIGDVSKFCEVQSKD